jgi:hypothetical protein
MAPAPASHQEIDMRSDETPAAIMRFIETTNAANPNGFVAAFTADASLDDWGRVFTGHDAIRRWDRSDNIGVQTRFELLTVEPGDAQDTYVAVIRVSGNGHNGTGPMVFTLRDDLIAGLRIVPSP